MHCGLFSDPEITDVSLICDKKCKKEPSATYKKKRANKKQHQSSTLSLNNSNFSSPPTVLKHYPETMVMIFIIGMWCQMLDCQWLQLMQSAVTTFTLTSSYLPPLMVIILPLTNLFIYTLYILLRLLSLPLIFPWCSLTAHSTHNPPV